MKIGIDMRQIVPGASGGIVPHLMGVLSTLFGQFSKHEYYVFTTIFNRGLFKNEYPHVRYFSLPVKTFFRDVDRIIASENISVLFRSYPMDAGLSFPLHRQIFFMPDVQHERFPEFFDPEILQKRREAFNQALAWGGAIGTNTEFTRQEIRSLPMTRCDDIFIMGPALQNTHEDEDAPLEPGDLAMIPKGDYFYFPANLWPHKNHVNALKALERTLQRVSRPVELVLSGHPEGWTTLQQQFPDLPVRHVGFVAPKIVRALLKHAKALVFFSLYEGFGMPLLEAFAAGTPVICSNTTALPEVGGDAVLSCAPDDVEAISELMVRVLQDTGLRQTLVARGKERLGSFSWKKSASALNQAFERVDRQAQARLDEKPLVSIVTPSYNQGGFIRETIESVLNQSYENIEYLVIDGGSTDGTREILKSYGSRFLWVSEPDRGQTHAINKGLALAHGEILAYLNSDDVLEPDAVEKAVRFLTTHPDIDLVYGKAYYVDKDGNITGFYNTDDYSFDRLMYDNCICQPAAFWRKGIVERCGPFDESLNFAMDYEYWIRIDRNGGKLQHIPDVLARSRLYSETKTLSERTKIFREIFEISRRYTGFVNLNYYYGKWNHLIWERNQGWHRLLRVIPRSFLIAANIEWLWTHRRTISLKRVVLWIQALVKAFLGRFLGFLRPLRHALLARSYKVSKKRRVFGIWDDNWTGPVFQVYLGKSSAGEGYYIKGKPALDTRIQVKEGSHTTRNIQAEAGKEIRIDFTASENQCIQLAFSNSAKDDKQRYAAFYITETNLFTEGDFYS